MGTFINAAAVAAGSAAGLTFAGRLPHKVRNRVMDGIGLVSIYLGVSMSLETAQPLIVIFSLILGGITGSAAGLEKKTGQWAGHFSDGKDTGRFIEGMTTAFLIFCMGSMTVVGAIEEGISGRSHLLLAKSLMDGFTSMALASAYGKGVLFSIFPLLLFQGLLTVSASVASPFLSGHLISNLTGVGGLMVIGLGITILDIKKITVIDYLPSLLYAALLSMVFPG